MKAFPGYLLCCRRLSGLGFRGVWGLGFTGVWGLRVYRVPKP